MKQAGTAYLQEEARPRGARPRVQATLYPFAVDYGLAPGAGTYVNTQYDGAPGGLAMAAGYFLSGSWTSPVMQAFSPFLSRVTPFWEAPASHLAAGVYLRAATQPEAVAAAPYAPLTQGLAQELGPYFQVRVEFAGAGRAWSIDSPEEADGFTAYAVDQAPEAGYESFAAEVAGGVAGLRLDGELTLPESEILEAGRVQTELARDFSELRTADHALVLDNRLGQWLSRADNACLQGQDWTQKQLALYHGWELPAGEVAWQLLYQGMVQRLAGLAHGWRQPHRCRLESQDAVAARLLKVIGAPDGAGTRQPFMRGPCQARGELCQTWPAAVSEPVKTGSGAASLKLLGDYRREYPQDYLVEAETRGEVGTATFRWSLNGGQSWQETGRRTTGADDPAALEQGLAVYWEAGPGLDLAAGDRWSFTATPPIYQYQVYGAPFQAISKVFLNGEETADRVSADSRSGLITLTGRSAAVEVRLLKDGTTHPVDIIADILAEVGLAPALDQDAFALAKSLTPEYAIGARFENLTAAQALREIVRRCLYDLWVEAGKIMISAYLIEA